MIIPIFATPIYHSNLSINPEDIPNFETVQNGEQTRSKDTYVLNQLPQLKEQIHHHVNDYAKNHYQYKQSFQITQSWFNYTQANQNLHVHVHPNSVFSGVVYIGEILSPITFERPDAFNRAWAFECESNWMTAIDFSIQPQHGDIIIFPSNLPHRVNANPLEGTRVSLAFNTFPIGAFGEEYGLTEVRRG